MFELIEHATLKHEKVLPIGKYYWKHVHDLHEIQYEHSNGLEVRQEEEPEILPKNYRKMDSKDWRKQDLYLTLGVTNRYLATDEEIKLAYKKRILKHHPDKCKEDAFFKCIQKSFEVLTDPIKRKQFDSVDPTFDDSVPDKIKDDFYETFGKVFESNARFSKKQPVPLLGSSSDTKGQVEGFYNFWCNFESWRSFEFLDEEEVEGESRQDKRHIEKKNKAARQKLKNEDNSRVTKLVETAMKLDPRLKKFREEEKAQKEAKKSTRVNSAQAQKEELKKKAEEEKLAKEKAEEAAKLVASEAKKAKEAERNLIRKEKKAIKSHLEKLEYFGNLADLANVELQLTKLEKIFNSLDLNSLVEFRERFTESDVQNAKAFFDEESERVIKPTAPTQNTAEHLKSATEESVWTSSQVSMLIKAVNQHPGGTVNRWQVIQHFLESHGISKTLKEIISKSQNVKQSDLIQ